MITKIKRKKLYFIDYSDQELSWIKKALSWEDDENNITDCLVFQDNENGPYYTYSGLLKELQNKAPFSVEIQNPKKIKIKRPKIPKNLLKGISLYDYQITAIKKSIISKDGIINIATGGGKSEVLLGTVKYLFDKKMIKKALIIQNSVTSADQLKMRAIVRGFNKNDVGVFHGGSFEIEKPIVICVINSIHSNIKKYLNNLDIGEDLDTKDKKIFEMIRDADFFGWNECQHQRGDSYVTTGLLAEKYEYFINYSGSPYQNPEDIMADPGDATVKGICGEDLCYVTNEYLRSEGFIAEPLAYFHKIPGTLPSYPIRYNNLYDRSIVKNNYRNNVIADFAHKFVKFNFPVLILVQRKQHAFNIMSYLPKECKTVLYFGGGESHAYDETGQLGQFSNNIENFCKNFNKGTWNVVIATQVFDEDVDIPEIAGAGRSRIKFLQRLGRGLRKKLLKNVVYLIDFIDRTHVYLFAQSKKRKGMLTELNIHIEEDMYKFMNKAYHHGQLMIKNKEKNV